VPVTDQPPDEDPADAPHEKDPSRLGRAGRALRGVAIDLSALRVSRDFRLLWLGGLISITGRQITFVALPYQVFQLTRSSFDVGLIGLAQLVPLIVFSIAGGPLVDRLDRRRVILVTEAGMAATSAMLLFGALSGHPPLLYLYAVSGLQAGLSGVNSPARAAVIANLVPKDRLPAAFALNQVMFNTTLIVGPSVAGVVLAKLGLSWAYALDLSSFIASITASYLLRPLPPQREGAEPAESDWRAVREGFAYLRRRRVLVSTFLIDLDAMIFGMPQALFPVLALTTFHVGPEGLGLLYAAPSAGALLGALTTGWVGRIRRQGLAVIWAVIAWGAAITAFGLVTRLFWLALALLAVAGAADVLSAVFRSTILQLAVPDALRGRISAVHIMVVTGGPRLGNFEAGLVASLTSPLISVVSGGLACIVGAALLAARIPELRRYHAGDER
jgi:MFS family permease